MMEKILQSCTGRILELQMPDGRINWIDDGIFDPWNHVLCAMALNAVGERKAADHALAALITIQEDDGALPGQCGASVPLDAANRHLRAEQASDLVDTNFTGFWATGLWHAYQVHRDLNWLAGFAEPLRHAIQFVLKHQSPHGDIAWRRKEEAEPLEAVDALLSGNCALYKSLRHARSVFDVLETPMPELDAAISRLGNAILHKPWRFDRTWAPKTRFAMDWYYPVLTGVLHGAVAHQHLMARMDEFVDPRFGCRCVNDQPWFTTAETCELVMALIAINEHDRAQALMNTLQPMAADTGGDWMGWQSEEGIFWPQERPSWTAAAHILALDALHGISPASHVLVGGPSL